MLLRRSMLTVVNSYDVDDHIFSCERLIRVNQWRSRPARVARSLLCIIPRSHLEAEISNIKIIIEHNRLTRARAKKQRAKLSALCHKVGEVEQLPL